MQRPSYVMRERERRSAGLEMRIWTQLMALMVRFGTSSLSHKCLDHFSCKMRITRTASKLWPEYGLWRPICIGKLYASTWELQGSIGAILRRRSLLCSPPDTLTVKERHRSTRSNAIRAPVCRQRVEIAWMGREWWRGPVTSWTLKKSDGRK